MKFCFEVNITWEKKKGKKKMKKKYIQCFLTRFTYFKFYELKYRSIQSIFSSGNLMTLLSPCM